MASAKGDLAVIPVPPEVGPAPKFTPPGVVRRKLSNGLEVLVAERHELPVLSLELVVKGGETLVPAEKHGLASLCRLLLNLNEVAFAD